MKVQWIVVANASLARLFRRDSPTDPLVPLTTMEHPESSTLWLFASSPFLGELKAQLSDAIDKRLQLALDSDLTSFGLAEIEQRLRDQRGFIDR